MNPTVFAEVTVGFERVENLEDALPAELHRRDPLPHDAAFLAGKTSTRIAGAAGVGSRRGWAADALNDAPPPREARAQAPG